MLDHAQKYGRVSWGSSPNSPGATGWYPIAGVDTPTFTINAGSATSKGTFYVNFREMLTRHQNGSADRVVAFLKDSAHYGSQTRHAESKGWASYPTIGVEALADAPEFVDKLLALLADASRSERGPRTID
jgi:hypothetical protein